MANDQHTGLETETALEHAKDQLIELGKSEDRSATKR